MGVFSNTDNPMGLKVSNRLKRILKDAQKGIQPSIEDTKFLVDESARFWTIKSHIKSEDFKIKDLMLDEEYELKDVLGDLMDELTYMYAHNIGQDGTYKLDLDNFSEFYERTIDRMSAKDIKEEVQRAVYRVKDLQKSFDDNGDELEAVGYLKSLKKRYNLDIYIKPDTDVEKVASIIVNRVVEVIKKEVGEREKTLKRLEG